jgi:hypothetical protein
VRNESNEPDERNGQNSAWTTNFYLTALVLLLLSECMERVGRFLGSLGDDIGVYGQ